MHDKKCIIIIYHAKMRNRAVKAYLNGIGGYDEVPEAGASRGPETAQKGCRWFSSITSTLIPQK